nr:unnamed protein product [Callosobruchus analis]
MEAVAPFSEYIRILLQEYSVGKYFGLIPPFLESKFRKKVCHGVTLIWICLFSTAQIFGATNRIILYLKYEQHVLTFLEILEGALMHLFVACCTWSSFKDTKKWKILLSTLLHVDGTASRLRCRLRVRMALYKRTVLSAFLILATMNISNTLCLVEDIYYIDTMVFIIMEVFMIAVICLVLQSIEMQYDQVFVVLQNSVRWTHGFEENDSSCFRQISMYYKECFELVLAFNNAFGWTSLLIFLNNYSEILICLIWGFDNFMVSDKYRVFMAVLSMVMHLNIDISAVVRAIFSKATMRKRRLFAEHIQIFMLYYKVGRFLGLVSPFLETGSKKVSYQAATCCWAIVLVPIEIYCIVTRTVMSFESSKSIMAFSDAFLGSLRVLSLIIYIHSALTLCGTWEKLFYKLIYVGNVASELQHPESRKDLRVYKIYVFTSFFITAILTLCDLHFMEARFLQYYLVDTFFLFEEVFMVSVMLLILNFIEKQYHYLIDSLKKIITKYNNDNFRKITVYYMECDKMVKLFNWIFSRILLLVVANGFFSAMTCFIWGLEEMLYVETKMIVLPLLYILISLSFSTAVVISCDKVIKKNEKLTRLCYILQVDITDEHLIEELNNFAYLTTQLQPKFTAGGFFTVNQNFFSAFLTSVASYCIICIQFNVKK